MAQIKQIGPGRKTTGTIDGVTYVTRKGNTYVRSTPTMPASAYNTPAAKKRQAIFKFIQMHLKLHLRTINQTFTPMGNGSPTNRYYSINGRALTLALNSLAELYLAGQDVTIDDVEQAISTYAAEHPKSIKIASMSGYQDVYLTGAWPETITLNALEGDNTMIIIVSENGTTTTINSDGSTTVVSSSTIQDSSGNSGSSGNQGSSSGSSGSSGSNGSSSSSGSSGSSGSSSVAAPEISGTTPFDDSTTVTITAAAGANIKYTTNGVAPSATYGNDYEEPITLNASATIKAVAIIDGVASEVATKAFVKNGSDGGSGEEGM